MIQSLLKGGAKIVRLTVDGTNNILAAGTTDVNSAVVDMQNFTGVVFVVGLGVIAASGAVTTKVQQGNAANLSDAADILGSAIGPTADTDDNKLIITELIRPTERYCRLVTTRGDGGNSTIDFVIAILYGARKQPCAADATVYSQEVIVGPTEGTA
jgi:hypothetical protein